MEFREYTSQFPINGYTMEANNQRVAQALAGEWLAEAPNSFKMELAERLGNAKTNIEKQSAIEDYKNNMDFYNNYAPKVKAFIGMKNTQNLVKMQ